MIDIKTLWSNYLLAIREKVIKTLPMEKEAFFELHKEYPNGMHGVPSATISQKVVDYYKLHNHPIYFPSPKRKTCPICNTITVKKKKA